MDLPPLIRTDSELDEILTRPTEQLLTAIKQLRSPLLVFGASGKMGPSLCLLAQRAAKAAGHRLVVVAVSRFSDPKSRDRLETQGVQTIACDLLDRSCLERLPGCENLVHLVGMKFGTQESPWQTWAVNTLVPAYVAERYPGASIVALSTGNVYPFTPVKGQGATETTPPGPVGEYANAALARERIFEHESRRQGTPLTILRLNYAVELRYGVLLDIAEKVWNQEPIDVTMGHLNCIWQGDANDIILRSFALAATPPALFNLTGPAVLSVRELATRFGQLLDREVQITGTEADTALLSDASQLLARLGPPSVPLEQVMEWTADWLKRGGPTLGKPTHFEVRSGTY